MPNVLLSTGAVTLSGGAVSVQGSSSTTPVVQSIGALTLTGTTSSQILLGDMAGSSGTGTSLTASSFTTPASGTTLYLNAANGGTLTLGSAAAMTFTPWAVVTNSSGSGFGSINVSHQLVLDTNTTAFTNSSIAGAVDYTTNPSTDTGAGQYSGGTLTLPSAANTADSLFITSGTGGTLDLGGGTLGFTSNALGMAGSGNFTIQHGQLGASNGTLCVNQVGSGTLAINSLISGGSGGIIKAGSGLLLLGGANTYTGPTYITGGTLQAGSTTPLGVSSTVTIQSGSMLDLNGNSFSVASVTSGTGGIARITDNGSASTGIDTLTFTAQPNSCNALITDGATRKVAIALVADSGNSAYETPTNPNNTFSGGLYLAGTSTNKCRMNVSKRGNRHAGHITSGPYGTGPIYIGTSATSYSELWFGGYGGSAVVVNPIIVNTNLGGNDSETIGVDGAGNQIWGAITLNTSMTIGPVNANYPYISLNGPISGTGGLTAGSGTTYIMTVTLDNTTGTANSYTGVTTVASSGVLVLGASNQVPAASNVSVAGMLSMGGFNQSIAGLSGAGIVDGANGAPTLTVGNNNQTSTFSGVLENTAGSLALTKIGMGMLTLSGTNAYTGQTTVSSGVLSIAGTNSLPGWSSAGSYSVANSAALAVGNGVTDSNIATILGIGNFAAGASLGFDTTAGSRTYAGVLADTGNGPLGLVKVGVNALTLTGSSTYSGGTTVSGGTLQLGDGMTNNGYVPGNILNNATLVFANPSGQTWSGVISGSGALAKAGAAMLTLAGADTYTGPTIVNSGALLNVSNSAALQYSTLTMSGGTALFNSSLPVGSAFTLGGLSATGGSITNSGGSTSTLNIFGGSTTASCLISGNIALVYSGSGNLTIGNLVDTYSGGTTVTSGTLTLTEGSGSGNIRGTLNINPGATVKLNAQNALGYNVGVEVTNVNINGGLLDNLQNQNEGNTYSVFTLTGGTMSSSGGGLYIIDSTSAITTLASSASTLISGPMQLQTNKTFNVASGTAPGGMDFVVSGAITSTSADGITKSGPGTMLLCSLANSYSGGTTANGGVLQLTGSLNPVTSLTVGGGAFSYANTASNATQTVNNLTVNAGASAVNSTVSSGTLNLGAIARNVGGTVDFTTTGTVTTTTANSTNGILGGYATSGGTTWAVSGSSGTSAITGLAAGSYVSDTWASGNNTTVTAGSNAADNNATTNSLRFNSSAADTVTLSGANVISSGGILVTSNVGSNLSTISGGTLEGASGKDLVVIQNNNNAGGGLTIASVIANDGSATALTKSGAGTLTLAANNTYTGTTYINAGTVSLANTGALGGSAINFGGGTLQYSAANNNDYSGRFSTAGNQPISIDTNGQSVTFATAIQGAATSLTLNDSTGAGTLTLTATNSSFTGPTTVNAGTLAFTTSAALGNPAAASTTINLGSGATLRFIGANATLNGAISLLGNATLDASGTSPTFGNTFDLTGGIMSSNYNLTLTGSSAVGGEVGSSISLAPVR